MKRILSILMTAAFVLAFGTASAGALGNGITDFSGASSGTFAINPGGNQGATSEDWHDATLTLSNGVTDFRGGSYETLPAGLGPKDAKSIEGTAAGGLRNDKDTVLFNGITYFGSR